MARSALVALAAVALVFAAATPAPAQEPGQPSAGVALKKLLRQTKALPSRAAPKKARTKLTRAARAARRNARKRPCRSVRRLARFRGVLRGIKVKKGSKPIAEVEGSAKEGANKIVWSGKSDRRRDRRRGSAPGPGKFTLTLTASGADGQRATAQAKLTLTKKR